MSKHGKNGKETKKVPLPKKVVRSKPQGLFERIIENEKNGLGLSTQRKEQEPARVTKLYLLHTTPRKLKKQ